MTNEELEKLRRVFTKYSSLKLVYFFGSRASEGAGPLSDYDFALYFDESDKNYNDDLIYKLNAEITLALKTDSVDTVLLNRLDSPELKYFIIRDGRIIFDQEPYRLIFEPRVIAEFFDFRTILLKHKLTKEETR